VSEIVVSEFMHEPALSGLAPRPVLYDPTLVEDRPRLLAALRGARAVIVRNRTQVNAELLAAAPGLRVVGRLGVGLDNVDQEACRARGVAVRPATGANAASVAEYVLGAALALLRGVFHANGSMLAGDWPRGALMGGELGGRALGLYGFGVIARETAARARALGMRVVAHDPHLAADDPAWSGVERLERGALLERADVLSLHVPLTPETRGLIDVEALALMKPGAALINTARGGVVDETALAAALKAGRLGGAALDVFETEPLTEAAARVFEGCPNLILTPHIAGVTRESDVRVSELTVANVAEALNG
jgi:(S)-sulfolactate dehydrogenase